jgi:glycosyltransferase involved in cell wall biosynthesis
MVGAFIWQAQLARLLMERANVSGLARGELMVNSKLLFVVTEDWYFVTHRLALAIAAKNAGFKVSIATNVGLHGDLIRSHGLELIHLELSRRGGNPLSETLKMVDLYKKHSPDIVHQVALIPVLYGSIAARITKVPQVVNAVSGLGWLFTSTSILARAVQLFFKPILSHLLSHRDSLTIVQNPEDRAFLITAGVPENAITLIRGAGVNTKQFTPIKEERLGPITIMMISRMLWAKGVGEFMLAARILRDENIQAQFILVGGPDLGNPTSVPIADLENWGKEDGFEWWGKRNDIAMVLSQADILCLPSYYGEGVPKVLLEGASTGLPLITTNTPGCKEVVENEINGILIPPRDEITLALSIKRLVLDKKLRVLMGRNGRKKALGEFSEELINSQTLGLYRM